MRILSFFVIVLTLVAAAVFAPVALAQQVCSSPYTVVAGDTLSEIAVNCGTTVTALQQANPQITDPGLIYVGEQLVIPSGASAPTPTPPVAASQNVSISPASGPAGTKLALTAVGLPANIKVQIGVGQEGETYDIVDTAKTDAQGNLHTNVFIPTIANQGETWVVTLVLGQGGQNVVLASQAFTVTQSAAPESRTNYIVHPGDTLSALALQYNTTVTALQLANPQITNPNLILVGERLAIPGKQGQQPTLVIGPQNGQPGTVVRAILGGFPANTTVRLGFGVQGSEPVVTETVTTDAFGNVNARITLPQSAQAGETWVAVATTTAGANVKAASNAFVVGPGNVQIPNTGGGGIYTVRSGDTLSGIAVQYNTSVAAILQANPSITQPNLIFPGEQITLPGGAQSQPLAIIAPTAGQAGTQVQLFASGFPANDSVFVSVGRPGQQATVVQQAVTQADGSLITQVTIPTTANPGEVWVVNIVSTNGSGIAATSNGFTVQ